MKSRLNNILKLVFLLTIISFGCSKEKANTLPNIVLIMADDLGFNDLGCYGNDQILTPNIDKLAQTGIRFTDFHSNGAVCSPTRAALMTGRYQQRTGISGVVTAKNHRHTGLAIEELTIADFLKGHHYRTGIVGKWHLGYDTLYSPVNNGFDYFKGYVSGNIDYHSHIDQTGYYDWWLNKDTLVEEGYSTDLFTKNALDFLSENNDQPFFLYIAHEAPHYPYQGRNDPADRTVKGQFKVSGSRTDKKNAYKEMIEVMDESVGSIVRYLEQEALLSNTLILFFSDNGANGVGSNDPLRGIKGSVWEGGHRVPAIAYWKGKFNAGYIHETLMTMDVFPTLIELTGSPKVDHEKLDGSSFLSLLQGPQTKMPARPLFWKHNKEKAIRFEEWKLIERKDSIYLFNLKQDLSEKKNLIEQYPGKRDSLLRQLHAWEKEMDGYENKTR